MLTRTTFTVLIVSVLTENNTARVDDRSWPVEFIDSFLSDFAPKEIHVLLDPTDLRAERKLCKSIFKSSQSSQYIRTEKSVNVSNYMAGRRVAMIVLSTSQRSINTVKKVSNRK